MARVGTARACVAAYHRAMRLWFGAVLLLTIACSEPPAPSLPTAVETTAPAAPVVPDAPHLVVDPAALAVGITRAGELRGPREPGSPCGGAFARSPDFVVEVTAPIERLHLSARGASSNPFLQWMPLGEPVIECSTQSMMEAVLELTSVQPGTYVLSIGAHGSSGGTYELRLGTGPEALTASDASTIEAHGEVTGALGAADVDAVVTQHLDELRACYERGPAPLRPRTIAVRLHVDERGAIWSIGRPEVGGPPLDALEQCAMGAMEDWRFPTGGGAVATYTFELAMR